MTPQRVEVQSAKAEEPRTADILKTLVVLERGNFVIECGREFQELNDAIVATNKPGKLVITLTVTPSGWSKRTNRPNQVDVNPQFEIKKPQPERAKSIFYVTEDNRLTRDDPEQEALFEGAR